jgi:endo-beta-N-acetylglucosaminidase D
MNVKGEWSRENQHEGGGGKSRILRGEEDILHVHVQKQHNETHHILYKKWGRKTRGNTNSGGDELFKVHCAHVWNYHNETSFYKCIIIKNIITNKH